MISIYRHFVVGERRVHVLWLRNGQDRPLQFRIDVLLSFKFNIVLLFCCGEHYFLDFVSSVFLCFVVVNECDFVAGL